MTRYETSLNRAVQLVHDGELHRALVFVIADPGAFTARGDSEPVVSWSARAAALLLNKLNDEDAS